MTYPPPPFMPERAPKTTTAAVVLLWVMLGIGACGSLSFPVFGYLVEAWTDDGLQPGLGTAIGVIAAALILWSALRGVFAVRIKRRRRSARIGAIVLEATGLAFTVLAWFWTTALIGPVTRTVATDSGMETTTSNGLDPTSLMVSLPGIVPSILITVFLSQQDSKRWCDR
ncbi:hypothetical protein [Glycomyces algeriensis]|uniref:Uncharacterized protein n=1 Tax=Glycomyces algeriensis TaxID=256037 RepID=A0A9W6GC76_9ACTN|nr:hypothetical protein [Glycomyces algeriensis]MDA1365698.1 hypothetical protein [Glycomyces algeriensis]MDR7351386.1 hypothetical protein [Glycomyces algeriensis]GLI44103.1 hypothetical protein GALLR39Z86_39530 [Glycomyces algeriensis]